MAQEVKIILDLSDEVHTFLEQQQINLYEDLQREMPSLRLTLEPDPDTPEGRRDPTTVILNHYTPANHTMHWQVEETETRHPDGTITIQRRRVSSRDEQRPWASLPAPTSAPSETTASPRPPRTHP